MLRISLCVLSESFGTTDFTYIHSVLRETRFEVLEIEESVVEVQCSDLVWHSDGEKQKYRHYVAALVLTNHHTHFRPLPKPAGR